MKFILKAIEEDMYGDEAPHLGVVIREFNAVTLGDIHEHMRYFLLGCGFLIKDPDDEENYETDETWGDGEPFADDDPKDLNWPFPKKFVEDEVNTWQTANT